MKTNISLGEAAWNVPRGFGLRRQSVAAPALSGGREGIKLNKPVCACESGVALRFPPQSKTQLRCLARPVFRGYTVFRNL